MKQLTLLLTIVVLAGCGMDATPVAPIPTTGPDLSLVDTAECLNAADGPITIWHAGEENIPVFTCAPKVIVSLSEESIAYDGAVLELDDVYSLVDGEGYVYTNEMLCNGDWPDTINGDDDEIEGGWSPWPV